MTWNPFSAILTANNKAPFEYAEVVTPNDSTNQASGMTRGVYVGVTGDVTMVVGGNAVLFKAMPVGIYWIRTTRVNATGTTATNILALY